MIIVQKGAMTISQLANALGKKPSWISRNVGHLRKLDLVSTKREGKTVLVNLNEGPLGANISTLISEEPMLNIETVLSGSGLSILPLVLMPGNNAKEIALRSSLSLRTVQGLLSRWRKMGVVTLSNGFYMLSARHKPLINFVKLYSYNTIIKSVKSLFSDASIIWHWRDEHMFSTEHPVEDNRFNSAATTRLRELNYEIIASKDYYFYNPIQKTVSEEEALIQSYLINPDNPRIHRMINEAMKMGKIDERLLIDYSIKYGLKKRLKEIIRNGG